jgi:hypothetical protein
MDEFIKEILFNGAALLVLKERLELGHELLADAKIGSFIKAKILFESDGHDFIGSHHGEYKIFLFAPNFFLFPEQSHGIRSQRLVNNILGFIDPLMN